MLADDVPGDRLNSQRRNVRASGPANASANQPTRTTPRAHANTWGLTYYCSTLRRGIITPGEKAIAVGGSYRDIDEAYLLQRPLPATTVAAAAAAAAASRHTPSPQPQQGLRNQHRLSTRNSSQGASGSQKLFCCRSKDPVCASRPAKKSGRLFCRGVAAKRHH